MFHVTQSSISFAHKRLAARMSYPLQASSFKVYSPLYTQHMFKVCMITTPQPGTLRNRCHI